MTNIIIHIGYHKTGTSYIQKNIFESFDKFIRIKQRDIFDALIYPDPFEYDDANGINFVQPYIAQADKENKILVLSNERLSGDPHNGGADSKEIANRLHKLPGNKKIIIGIREQKDFAYSSYSQYIKAVGSVSLDDYLEPKTKKNKYLFHKDFLKYEKLITYYIGLFGKENVLILPYEKLKHFPSTFNKSILDFIGIDLDIKKISTGKINSGYKPIITTLKRYFNPFVLPEHPYLGDTYSSKILSYFFRFLHKLINFIPTKRIDRRIKTINENIIAKHLANYYCENNLILQQILNEDIQRFGYEICDKHNI